jgi:hypothetical protein
MSAVGKYSMPLEGVGDAEGSVAQHGNLRYLEKALHGHWNLGQRLLLCWTPTDSGIAILMAPHNFLARFSASLNDCAPVDRLEALNGSFIRKLIAGQRRMETLEFEGTARRLDLTPTAVKLPVPVTQDEVALIAVEAMVRRFSISYVDSRAVLLFDIVDFSLYTPFEQTSQLNSLSYSLNTAHNKLLQHDINVNFARTTTGDGFYVWNRDTHPAANVYLFYLMLLVVANNTIARSKAAVNTVPYIRTGFHVGSHYEFSQAEALNPTMSSYIVGDVTIELARILGSAKSGQIAIGDFVTHIPTSLREGAYLIAVDTVRYVERMRKGLDILRGLDLSGESIRSIHCYLTGENGPSGGETIRGFRVTDKHGFSRNAYNLRMNIRTESGASLLMGSQSSGSMGPLGGARSGAASEAQGSQDDYTGYRRARPRE